MNPRGRPTDIQIACLESRAEMPAFASEIDQVLKEGRVLQPSWGPKRVLATVAAAEGVLQLLDENKSS